MTDDGDINAFDEGQRVLVAAMLRRIAERTHDADVAWLRTQGYNAIADALHKADTVREVLGE